ncbi:methyl-CpG-binding protein [Gracilaria domingensis]|nr:methyl-CpG-binding protein [Gracilaria domingensis]
MMKFGTSLPVLVVLIVFLDLTRPAASASCGLCGRNHCACAERKGTSLVFTRCQRQPPGCNCGDKNEDSCYLSVGTIGSGTVHGTSVGGGGDGAVFGGGGGGSAFATGASAEALPVSVDS